MNSETNSPPTFILEDELKEEEFSTAPTQDYRVSTYPSDFRLDVLHQLWKKGDLFIDYGYQRNYVWSHKQACLLIESFLRGMPVPPIFLYVDDSNRTSVIDGQQRILSIVSFLQGTFDGVIDPATSRSISPTGDKPADARDFILDELNPNNKYYGKSINSLEEKDRRKLEGSVIRAINITPNDPDTDGEVVYMIFERLNTAGTPLNAQEIRNSASRGEFAQLLASLNNLQSWRKIMGTPSADKRRRDVEILLRVFSFTYYSTSYSKPMRGFLNKVMHKNRNLSTQTEDFEARFDSACSYLLDTIGPEGFRPRGRLNAALVESMVSLALRYTSMFKDDWGGQYQLLLSDPEFVRLTMISTSDKTTIDQRLEILIERLLTIKSDSL